MKRNIILLIVMGFTLFAILAVGIGLIRSEEPANETAVAAANGLYEAGNYSEAIQVYEQIIAQDVQDSTVFYNLGNAYYRQGDLGRAILNYQRASQLDPRDPDIRANLTLARSKAVDPFDTVAPGPIRSLANLTGRWLTINETAIIAISIWFLAGFLIMAQRLLESQKVKMTLRIAMIFALFLILITGLSIGSRVYIENTQPSAVIVAPVVAVSSEPGSNFATEFSLTSGTEIGLSEMQGNWIELTNPGESWHGWVPYDSVELVAPKSLINRAL